MEFFRVYGRVIGLLRAERGLAIGLALANIAVAGLSGLAEKFSAQLAALDDGEGREALTKLVAATGDYKKSLTLMTAAQEWSEARALAQIKRADALGPVQLVGGE